LIAETPTDMARWIVALAVLGAGAAVSQFGRGGIGLDPNPLPGYPEAEFHMARNCVPPIGNVTIPAATLLQLHACAPRPTVQTRVRSTQALSRSTGEMLAAARHYTGLSPHHALPAGT
jgi:hypothetical protein